MTIIFSEHAIDELEKHDITEDEARACLQYGELVIKQIVKGEMRYGKQLELKAKKIIVIYTYEKNNTRVITCYPIKRKKWQSK